MLTKTIAILFIIIYQFSSLKILLIFFISYKELLSWINNLKKEINFNEKIMNVGKECDVRKISRIQFSKTYNLLIELF